jgi:hypothetical protein
VREKDLDQLVHGAKSEIETFYRGTAQSDDINMLALQAGTDIFRLTIIIGSFPIILTRAKQPRSPQDCSA